ESVTLKNQQRLTEKHFISLRSTESQSRRIARVQRIWGTGGCVEKQIVIEATHCELGQISEFYSIRELKECNAAMWIKVMDVEGILNVQHDCHHSQCTVQKIRPIMVEQRVSKGLEFDVVHEPTKYFIINLAAFYSAELHRSAAQVPFVDVDPGQWIIVVCEGR
ncbi:hypothetical protein DFH28DRAFT_872283, partial [Melampsora americana]